MLRSFESLLAGAADKRASVRIEPKRDPRTGNLVFTANIHGEPNPSSYLVNGSIVTQIATDPADRKIPAALRGGA